MVNSSLNNSNLSLGKQEQIEAFPAAVRRFDIDQFCGKWYEISTLPWRFGKNRLSTTVTFTKNARRNFTIEISSQKTGPNGGTITFKGNATPHNKMYSEMKVKFLWPFSSNFWVLKVDPEYQWAVVAHPPGKRQMSIYSRSPKMEKKVYEYLVDYARSLGYEVDSMMIHILDGHEHDTRNEGRL